MNNKLPVTVTEEWNWTQGVKYKYIGLSKPDPDNLYSKTKAYFVTPSELEGIKGMEVQDIKDAVKKILDTNNK